MRYPPAHKDATRRRILDAAGRTFRERGVSESGVDEVMRRAGLTHGGFYAHFEGKEDLIASACSAAFEAAIPNLDRIAAVNPAINAVVQVSSRLLLLCKVERRENDQL